MNIVCYTGGTCGDMISAIIDTTAATYRNTTVMHEPGRTRLKKPHLFKSDDEKDQYLIDAEKKYQSIPSHDLDYHIRKGHEFIGITVSDRDIALWAANRFKHLHRPHVWDEMTAMCGVNSIEGYAQIMIDFSNLIAQHTDKIITLESIYNGTALSNPILHDANETFYLDWLALQQKTDAL
jgi:hypothetical protein